MAATTWSGPIKIGEKASGSTKNVGTVVLSQSVRLVADGENAVSGTLYLPTKALITDMFWDVPVAFDSATSATGTVGLTAGGTEYASGANLKTGIRIYPTFTRPQVAAMSVPGTATPIVATATPTGATTAGEARLTVQYTMG
jgi:hypothetical protein